MNVRYRGMNERKSEHSDFVNLPSVFSALKKRLSEFDVTTAIGKITQIQNLELINDRFGFGLHQGGKDSFLDIHVDYNLHPLQRKQRRINLILFLNTNWEKDWGGALELWNKDVTKCEQSILPLFNRCVLFECNEYSFHGYSKINCPEEITRKSFYQYYFTEPEKTIFFHDTVFKSKPLEPTHKKIAVQVKETLKNSGKRLLYYLKLKKLLK
jgi:Rps23 Pro-64 3,4-dihydroxylase Tpa1-like proline 4-hydroxylase